MNDAQEEWRPIAGYEGLYSISSFGRVKTHPRDKGYPKKMPPGGILARRVSPRGYHQVSLSAEGKTRPRYVHQLVLESFVGPRPSPKHQACHNDGDTHNNAVRNLRWDTVSANIRDQLRHGTNYRANLTHCPRSHEYTLENTKISGRGARLCRQCTIEYNERRRSARRTASDGAHC